MILLRKPEPYALRQYLDNYLTSSFSYAEVGATNSQLPSGYAINHTRRQLGQGIRAFEAGCDALRLWQQLQLGWVDCWPKNAPLRQGEQLAVIGRAFGLWWLNACRVVYTLDDRHVLPRFGYAHGTLSDHIAMGEERFLVEMNADETVWIDVLAFSRPNTMLAHLGYPVMRRAQKRFGIESVEKIFRFVTAALSQPLESTSQTSLFVTQRINGIESTGAPGRIVAKADPNQRGEYQSHAGGWQTDHNWPGPATGNCVDNHR